MNTLLPYPSEIQKNISLTSKVGRNFKNNFYLPETLELFLCIGTTLTLALAGGKMSFQSHEGATWLRLVPRGRPVLQ